MKKISIVVQGPLRSIETTKKVCENLSFFKNQKVFFSTWNSEDLNCISYISSFKWINLILNNKPKSGGPQNLIYQMLSSYNGIKECDDDSVCVKTRSDIIISNPKKLIKNINNINIGSDEIVTAWNLDKFAIIGDFVVIGGKKSMMRFWEPDYNPIFSYHAEMYLQNRFFNRKSEDRYWQSIEKNEPDWFKLLASTAKIEPNAGSIIWLKNNKQIIPYRAHKMGVVAWPHNWQI